MNDIDDSNLESAHHQELLNEQEQKEEAAIVKTNAWEKLRKAHLLRKLQEARVKLHNTELKKTGKNKFANYSYFELSDFLPDIMRICNEIGLCGIVRFTSSVATLTIHDTDSSECVVFESPMSKASLKGCHDVQNLGAVQTYLRRYLWTMAFELVEHDALDATTGASDGPAQTKNKTQTWAYRMLEDMCKETETDIKSILNYYEVARLEDLPRVKAIEATERLQKKAEKMKEFRGEH